MIRLNVQSRVCTINSSKLDDELALLVLSTFTQAAKGGH